MTTDSFKFDETILYKTKRHPIVMLSIVLKHMFYIALPLSIIAYFVLTDFSIGWTLVIFTISLCFIIAYQYYLWSLSWFLIGNQKITLFVREGLFSQYSMNIRYRNIRDCACSKNNFFSYLFKYGSFFARSNGAEGDFTATFVPKVGKIYALINALTRYNDDEREKIKSIEALHSHHINKEFPLAGEPSVSGNTQTLLALPGITGVVELVAADKKFMSEHEEVRNHGVFEVLRRKHVLCFTHDHNFRPATGELVQKNARGEVFFEALPFPEVKGNMVVSASPSQEVHEYLSKKFEYITQSEATVLVGWN